MSDSFRFRRNDSIGFASAEDDEAFLRDCFVDCGNLSDLEDRASARQIVIGRTGSGKSALLWKIAENNPGSSVVLSPDNLALTYVANSDIVIYYSKLGINLDPFFKLLWRHILTVEVLKRYLENHPNLKRTNFVDTLIAMVRGEGQELKEERETVEYLKKWGEDFWIETEYRVKEITQKLEDNLKAGLEASGGADLFKAGVSFEAYSKLTDEQKVDVQHRAQKVVSEAQVKDLSRVTKLIDSILTNKQQVYYVLIDRLDESWVEDELRYRLILALIETIKDLNKVKNVKIVIAMRRDLIDRVFRCCRPAGFQEEKFRDFYSIVTWGSSDLLKALDRRINHLVRDRYEKMRIISHADIMPSSIDRMPIGEYLSQRVTRPRDLIAFFNECIYAADGKARITVPIVRDAEIEYSRGRLRALADEWQSDFPKLIDLASILKAKRWRFKLDSLDEEEMQNYCLELAVRWGDEAVAGELEAQLIAASRGEGGIDDLKRRLFRAFYRVGLIGLKLESFESYVWADERSRSLSLSDLSPGVGVEIHKTFYRVLGVSPR